MMFFATLLVVLSLPSGTWGESDQALLVGQKMLEDALGTDASVYPVDVRSRAEYDAGHIAGAIWVDLAAAKKLASRPGGLQDKAAWEAWVEQLGIEPTSVYVIYDGDRQVEAARVWWLLKYLGVPRVGLLDGSFAAWKEAMRPIQTKPRVMSPRRFEVAFDAKRLAMGEEVAQMLEKKSHRVVDARSDEEFRGTDRQSRRGGHMPAACHLEWTNFVDEKGRFQPIDVLRLKAEAAGLEPGEPVVTHCQGGGRASLDAFVMERLGHPTRNYYLGWSEWGNRDDVPVEIPD